MIQPEPNWAADLSGLQPGEAATNVPLPAAGRLGVIEEQCLGSHDPDEYFDDNCNFCGGEV